MGDPANNLAKSSLFAVLRSGCPRVKLFAHSLHLVDGCDVPDSPLCSLDSLCAWVCPGVACPVLFREDSINRSNNSLMSKNKQENNELHQHSSEEYVAFIQTFAFPLIDLGWFMRTKYFCTFVIIRTNLFPSRWRPAKYCPLCPHLWVCIRKWDNFGSDYLSHISRAGVLPGEVTPPLFDFLGYQNRHNKNLMFWVNYRRYVPVVPIWQRSRQCWPTMFGVKCDKGRQKAGQVDVVFLVRKTVCWNSFPQ